MKSLLNSAFIFTAIVLLIGCSKKEQTNQKGTTKRSTKEIQQSVKTALAEISSVPMIVDMKKESTLAIWLDSEIKMTGKNFGNIREASLKRVNERDNTYGMSLLKSWEIAPIMEGKEYIEIHFIHEVSDPEVHGIVDPSEPKLVAIFEDGGA